MTNEKIKKTMWLVWTYELTFANCPGKWEWEDYGTWDTKKGAMAEAKESARFAEDADAVTVVRYEVTDFFPVKKAIGADK